MVLSDFFNRVADLDLCYDIVYGQVEHVYQDGSFFSMGGKSWSETYSDIYYKGRMMAHQGVFHNANLFYQGKRFDENSG